MEKIQPAPENITQEYQIIIADPAQCYLCKSTGLKETDNFCSNCGFPQKGSQDEMKIFIEGVTYKKKILAGQSKAIKKAQNLLYILAAINLVAGIAFGVGNTNYQVFTAGIITSAIYYALAVWSKTQAFPAFLSGFFVFIVLNIISAFIDSSSLYKGLILKGIVVYGFIYGYKGIKDSQKLERELEVIGKAKDLTIKN